MRILLLGDFSSLYTNLKDGLEKLGHNVTLASTGDAWKNIDRDIDLTHMKNTPYFISKRVKPMIILKDLKNFDIVQFINPFYMRTKYFPNKFFFKSIAENSKKFYISAAGDDAYFWRYSRNYLKYSPLNDYLKYDVKSKYYYMESEESLKWNNYIISLSNGVIPIMYEYQIGYNRAKSKKLLPLIPIPMNIEKIVYQKNIVKDKIVIFHGLNRYGFKGTKYIEEAFSYLKDKYPNDLELIIDGGLPLDEYLELMKKTNIVIDQMNSYSLGVNGIYAMAMGKVVIGGAESESLLANYNVESSPIINVKPSSENLIEVIENLIENRDSIKEIGRESREFVQEHHDYIKVAKKYLEIWNDYKL